MKKAAVVGHFGFGYEYYDGQTVKTKMLFEQLKHCLGEEDVSCVDTHGGMKTTPKILLKCFSVLKKHSNVIALPAHNGLRIVIPWLLMLNRFFKRKLHYVVVGGWLSEFLKDKKSLAKKLKKLDGIYVETTSMKVALEAQGFENIVVMPNCKNLAILKEDELVYPEKEPYKLCTFSRVMKEKGIEEAIEAVRAVNERFGRTVYSLDIYGPVDSEQTEWFEKLKATFLDYVNYKGIVRYDKSVEVLKDYFALLFPTRFYTEGIPGTLIDAYASGVPVITALWMNSADVFNEDECGFGYVFDNFIGLRDILLKLKDSPEDLLNKKVKCLKFAENYTSEKVVKILVDRLA